MLHPAFIRCALNACSFDSRVVTVHIPASRRFVQQHACLQCMCIMFSCILSSQDRPCVLQESLLQLATVCMCVCLFFFVRWLDVRNSTHPKRRSSAHPPAPCRSVHPVCMTAYLPLYLVFRSHSICSAADKSMARSQCFY